jgi:2-polyprenyl-3-methyl-5-hydroxy-6-metoxy-1,4-benzoquinol methylase
MRTSSAKYDLLAQLAGPAQTLLDVGCGGGELALAVTPEKQVIDGVDISLARLGDRRRSYRNLWEMDVENPATSISYEDYSALIFADVLEHLQRPSELLLRVGSVMQDEAALIVSLPNVAFWTNRLGLFCGQWEYQDQGILDRTHLHFYTLQTARDLIQSAGFVIDTEVAEVPILSSPIKQKIFSQATTLRDC